MNIKIKHFCLSLYAIVDPIYFHFTRLHYIKNKSGDKTIMRVRLTKYKGRRIMLSDGTVVNKNDILLKIHLHNVKLFRKMQGFDSEIKKALMIYKSVQEALPCITHYIKLNGYSNEIKGIIGITMLHKGCRKLGFESFTIHNPYYKLFKQLSLSPIHFLASTNKEKPLPMYLFMSKDRLFDKYENI